MLSLKVIVGSTRGGRLADRVAPWVVERATAHGAFAVQVLDLRDVALPMFQETDQVFASPEPVWSTPAVTAWNRAISAGDAFLVVTPEYNRSVPPVLKNAIDSVYASYGFRNKAAGFVGYSIGRLGGARAVEHLANIAVEHELVPLSNAVLIPQAHQVFASDAPLDPGLDTALEILLDDLAWWGEALRRARALGELPPSGRRPARAPRPAGRA